MSNDEVNRKLQEAAAEQKGQAVPPVPPKKQNKTFAANRAFEEARGRKAEEDRTSSK